MRHSPRSLRAWSIALLFATLSVPLLLSSSSTVQGDFPGPFFVDGTVTDSEGRPIQGADVVVVSKHGNATVSTVYGVTDENGFYTVSLPPETVDYNHTIIATATYQGNQESEQAVPVDNFGLTIDIMFPFEIPEFGTLLGFLAAAGIVAAVAVFLLPKRLKRLKQKS